MFRFRTASRIAPLLSSLLFGAACASGVMVAAGTVAGCSDENDPATHVKKLSDTSTRAAAVNRLIQFFEDAMSRDKGDRAGPTVKPLLDTIIQPMNEMCLSGDLDERTNAKLVKFISDARDPRGGDCLVKVLKDFKPEAKETEETTRYAARAIGAMKLKTAGAPLMDAFLKLRPSKLKKEPELYRDVRDAMVEMVLADPNDKAWEPQLLERIGRPIADKKDMQALRDEVYWQTTAAELLGLMKSSAAVKPLLKIMLSPFKADIAYTAINSLIKIGKPSIAPTIALLRSEDKELVEYSKGENLKAAAGPDGKVPEPAQKAAEKAHIGTAAIILSSIGREEGVAPLLEVLDKGDDLSRAVIARELSKLPKTPASLQAFQTAYEKTPTSLDMPGGSGGAREAMLEAAGMFFDASIVPWLVKTALDLKGEENDIDSIRAVSLTTSMKLMTVDQIGEVDKLYSVKANGPDGKPSTLGKAYEKEYKIAKDLVGACKANVDCYLGKAIEPTAQTQEGQFQGIKSLYMVGVVGTSDARAKIMTAMPKLSNAALRFVASQVLDRLSPKGDAALSAQLQKIIEEGEASKDSNKVQGNAPLKTVAYRLNARAQ